jgi:hypothetical protein
VATVLQGSCLCGKVRYEIRGAPRVAYYCHCGRCRKQSGSAFAANVAVRREDFAIVSGEDMLRFFQHSSSLRRYFCSGCGSPIYGQGEKYPHIVTVRCGSLDTDLDLKPSVHAFVAHKANWDEIRDDLPQHAEYFA